MTTTKLQVDAAETARAISWAIKGASGPQDVNYNAVKVELSDNTLELSCFDGTDTYLSTVDVIRADADDTTNRTLYVPAQKMAALARVLKRGEAVLSLTGNGISANINKSKFSVPERSTQGIRMPKIPAALGKVDGDVFRSALSQVTSAASNDPSMPLLTCVFFDFIIDEGTLRMVATNRYQLAVVDIPLEVAKNRQQTENFSLLIPASNVKKIVNGLNSDDQVTFFADNARSSNLGLKTSDKTVVLNLFDGKYADYKRLTVTTVNHEVLIDKSKLKSALSDAIVVSDKPSASIHLTIDKNGSSLAMSNGDSLVPVDTEGYDGEEPLRIIFDSQYLSGALNALISSHVVFQINTPLKAIVLREADDQGVKNDRVLYLVMPRKA